MSANLTVGATMAAWFLSAGLGVVDRQGWADVGTVATVLFVASVFLLYISVRLIAAETDAEHPEFKMSFQQCEGHDWQPQAHGLRCTKCGARVHGGGQV